MSEPIKFFDSIELSKWMKLVIIVKESNLIESSNGAGLKEMLFQKARRRSKGLGAEPHARNGPNGKDTRAQTPSTDQIEVHGTKASRGSK